MDKTNNYPDGSNSKTKISVDELLKRKRQRNQQANIKNRNTFRNTNEQLANRHKENRKEALRWEAAHDLEQKLLDKEFEAEVEFNAEYKTIANQALARVNNLADEEANLLMQANDEVFDVEFEDITLELPERKSRFLVSSNNSPQLPSSNPTNLNIPEDDDPLAGM